VLDVKNVNPYTINNLTDGSTFYFAVTAYDSAELKVIIHPNSKETLSPLPVQNYTLTTSKTGTGAGSVTSSPGGITCGTICSGSYASVQS